MRQPNHIILDFEHNSSSNSNCYWALNLLSSNQTPLFMDYVNVSRKYTNESTSLSSKNFIGASQTNTVKSSDSHKASFLQDWEKRGLSHIYKSAKTANSQDYDMFDYLNSSPKNYQERKLSTLLKKYNQSSVATFVNTTLNTDSTLINVNFLRKERLYTKLKYSRSPAYDIVSGGAAALLAGFIGFLISEKFGYELVDSGDFYYAFMYVVFAVFSIKPLLTVSDSTKGFIQCLSPRSLILFYTTLCKLVLSKFK